MDIVKSVFKQPIRLTNERWNHIIRNHPEMDGMRTDVLEVLSDPDIVIEGHKDEFLSIKFYAKSPVSNNKYLVVFYKEDKQNNDGFVITSYFTRRHVSERKILWKR